MEYSDDVAKLAIINEKTISESYRIMCDIEESFHKYIIKFLKEYIQNHHKDWWVDGNTFGPLSWPEDNDNYQAYYELAWWGEENFWTLHAAGTDNRGLGIALIIEPALSKNVAYTSALSDFFQKNAHTLSGTRLISCFGKRKQYLAFPFKSVTLESLAESYPDWENAMEENMNATLEYLEHAHKSIHAFVQKLKKTA